MAHRHCGGGTGNADPDPEGAVAGTPGWTATTKGWRVTRATRSGGDFHGYIETSEWGASIAASMAMAYGCSGVSCGSTSTGVSQARTKSRVTVNTKSGWWRYMLLRKASAIGMVLAMFAAASFIVRIVMPRLVERFSEEQVLTGSIFIASATYMLFPLVESGLVLAAIAFLLGLGTGCGQPLTLMMIYARAPEGRSGEALGLRMAINNLTHLVVPLFFGALGSAFGVTPVFLANAMMLGVGGMISRRR